MMPPPPFPPPPPALAEGGEDERDEEDDERFMRPLVWGTVAKEGWEGREVVRSERVRGAKEWEVVGGGE